MKIGVLAVQGGFASHVRALEFFGHQAKEVKTPNQLSQIDALIIPGGESTTMLKLISTEFEDQIISFAKEGHGLLGTCAGLILIAEKVLNPSQRSFALLPLTVERNAFGRQINSFVTDKIQAHPTISKSTMEGTFIRAPRITKITQDVKIIASYENEPVAVQLNKIFGFTYHPELTPEKSKLIYEYVFNSWKSTPNV